MFDDAGRLPAEAVDSIVTPATGGALPAAAASEREPGPYPTPPGLPPRPAADSPGSAPPVVLSLEWRVLTPTDTARVGQRAWSIWRELLELRDPAGDCRATAAGLGRRLVPGLSAKQVQKQITKLRRLGLVAGGGWRYADVPVGRGRGLVEVYERRVVGDRVGDRVGLPPEVWLAVAAAGRGGARPGAGRPRNQNGEGLPQGDADPHLAGTPTPFDFAGRQAAEGGPKYAESVQEKSNGVTEVRDKEKDNPSSLFFLRKKEIALTRDFSLSGVQSTPGAAAPGVAEVEGAGAPSQAAEGLMEATSGLLEAGLPGVVAAEGVSLEGRGVRVEVSAAEWGELPPYPGVEVIQPAVVPGPPRIQLGTSEDDRVQLCLTAYSLTCRRQLPGVWNPHDRHELKPAERKLLLAAAAALCDHEVSPLRWVEFSFDQWKVAQQAAGEAAAAKGGKGRRKGPPARPPLKVVFSTARIGEHAGWCRTERERRSQQLVMTRSLRTVLAKWQQMRAAVLRGEMTPAAARDRFFPGDSYQRQIDRAREEARREQARIATSIASGEYLW